MESLLYNEDGERRISNQDELKPGLTQVMETTKQKTDYEPGSPDYHETAVQIAEQLANPVTEDNSDATYDEIMDIDSEAFEMLDRVGGQNGVITEADTNQETHIRKSSLDYESIDGAQYLGRFLADSKFNDLNSEEEYLTFAQNVFDHTYRKSQDPEIALEATESAKIHLDRMYGKESSFMEGEIQSLRQAVEQIEEETTNLQWNRPKQVEPWTELEDVSLGDIKAKAQ
jgi:hypothetical protein